MPMKRQCSKCKKLMDRGEVFYKVCRVENHGLRLIHTGDLCPECWEEIERGKV